MEGKGPKGKGKGKEVAAKADEKDGNDSDAVWMVSAGDEIIDEVGDKVAVWLQGMNEGSRSKCYLWTEDEISGNDNFDVVNHSPAITDTKASVSSCDLDINDFISNTLTSESEVDLILDLEIMGDSSEDSILEADEETSEEALDLDKEPRTSTFAAAILASSISQTTEIELFDSGTRDTCLLIKINSSIISLSRNEYLLQQMAVLLMLLEKGICMLFCQMESPPQKSF